MLRKFVREAVRSAWLFFVAVMLFAVLPGIALLILRHLEVIL